MKNAKPKDYLGKAKLVAAENANEVSHLFILVMIAYSSSLGVHHLHRSHTNESRIQPIRCAARKSVK
jgi:hypothetical protein